MVLIGTLDVLVPKMRKFSMKKTMKVITGNKRVVKMIAISTAILAPLNSRSLIPWLQHIRQAGCSKSPRRADERNPSSAKHRAIKVVRLNISGS